MYHGLSVWTSVYHPVIHILNIHSADGSWNIDPKVTLKYPYFYISVSPLTIHKTQVYKAILILSVTEV